MTRSPRLVLVLGVFALQFALLTIGLTRDYRLKHEDNNALHATFARSHLRLGLATTKAQNYFYTPATQSGTFYANHPPGPGIVLAAVYGLTGRDGPATTRATAVGLHVFAAILFFGLARRVSADEWEALLAALVFVLLPESAFFGRMMNHEVLVLPVGILLVWSYWETLHASGRREVWRAVCAASCVGAALAGWAGFFVIGACGLHAVWEMSARGNTRARGLLVLLLTLGGVLLVVDVVHLVWVQDDPARHLRDLFVTRMGLDADQSVAWRVGRILEIHWRYFGVTSMLALALLVYRGARNLRQPVSTSPSTDVGLIFFVAGIGYVSVFNLNAAQHDYWQFLLLPASAIAIAVSLRWLYVAARQSRRRVLLVLLVVACIEILLTVGITLTRRHTKSEAYCLETVEALRRDVL